MEETNERYKKTESKRRKKKKRQVRQGCIVTPLCLVCAFVLLFLTPIFAIKKIDVEGNENVKTQQIVAASGIQVNKNLFSANLGSAKKKIMQVPYVESVKIKRKLPDTIKIEIKEGRVGAYLKWNKKYVGINESGQILCVADKVSATAKAPVVKGITVTEECAVGKKIAVKQTNRLEILMKFMKTFREKGMTEDITLFDITQTEYISIKHRDKLKIEFGSTANYEHKFSFIDALLETMGKDVEGELNMVSENYTYGHTVQ